VDFRELRKARYSCRDYQDRPVDEKMIQELLEAARSAPTAANRQALRFVVIRDKHKRESMKAAYSREWFYTAPVIICACGVPDDNWVRSDGKNYNDVDVAIAMDHLILQAADLGLGTCWIAAFDPQAAREILSLPAGVEPVALTPVGHPADSSTSKRRKNLNELVVWEGFEE